MPPLSDNNLKTVTFQLLNMSSGYQIKCNDQIDLKNNQLVHKEYICVADSLPLLF